MLGNHWRQRVENLQNGLMKFRLRRISQDDLLIQLVKGGLSGACIFLVQFA
jgi:hypothetical protein